MAAPRICPRYVCAPVLTDAPHLGFCLFVRPASVLCVLCVIVVRLGSFVVRCCSGDDGCGCARRGGRQGEGTMGQLSAHVCASRLLVCLCVWCVSFPSAASCLSQQRTAACKGAERNSSSRHTARQANTHTQRETKATDETLAIGRCRQGGVRLGLVRCFSFLPRQRELRSQLLRCK